VASEPSGRAIQTSQSRVNTSRASGSVSAERVPPTVARSVRTSAEGVAPTTPLGVDGAGDEWADAAPGTVNNEPTRTMINVLATRCTIRPALVMPRTVGG